MQWLKRLFRTKQEEPTEPFYLLCSGCKKPCRGADAHVIPHWNTDREDFLTTYRCGHCWHKSLQETRTKIKALDAEIREKFCKFLDHHGYARDTPIIRRASLVEASEMIGRVLDAIESEKLRLSP